MRERLLSGHCMRVTKFCLDDIFRYIQCKIERLKCNIFIFCRNQKNVNIIIVCKGSTNIVFFPEMKSSS